MPTAWNLLPTDGYDVEDTDKPRTLKGVCPVCEHRVVFVERLLVRNLRVLGVPLFALDRSGKTFQCERCASCFETPKPSESGAKPAPPERTPAERKHLSDTQATILRVEEELALWRLRANVARKKGDADATAEATAKIERYRAAVHEAQTELARAQGLPPPPPLAPEAAPPAVEPAAPAIAAAPPAPAPTPPAAPVVAPPTPAPLPTSEDDELAALKRKLKKRD